jgi:hypothetical protein
VLNVALTVDGRRPIGAQARRRNDGLIVLRLGSSPPSDRDQSASSSQHAGADDGAAAAAASLSEPNELPETVVVCRQWADCADFGDPNAPAALLKASLVAIGWVRPPPLSAVAAEDTHANPNETGNPGGADSTGNSSSWNCGIELCVWSLLPRGSGLGTSSILAAAVFRALAALVDVDAVAAPAGLDQGLASTDAAVRASALTDPSNARAAGASTSTASSNHTVAAVATTGRGRHYDAQALAHSVLRVEQLMSCGGGWQDQIGGVLRGFKLTYSSGPRLPLPPRWREQCASTIASRTGIADDHHRHPRAPHPLEVWPCVLDVDAAFAAAFGAHTVLIYTGLPRLAKNLLQSVLRRWYGRSADIVGVVDALCANAAAAAAALVGEASTLTPTPALAATGIMAGHAALDCDENPAIHAKLAAAGAALDAYWTQKKQMATDAEPAHVTAMMAKLRPMALGM